MGYPLLVTFNLYDNLTMSQIRNRIWQLTKPFVADENIDVNDNDKPFVMQAQWAFNNVAELTDDDQDFNLDERNMKFVIILFYFVPNFTLHMQRIFSIKNGVSIRYN